jgi:hypothetical protein
LVNEKNRNLELRSAIAIKRILVFSLSLLDFESLDSHIISRFRGPPRLAFKFVIELINSETAS